MQQGKSSKDAIIKKMQNTLFFLNLKTFSLV